MIVQLRPATATRQVTLPGFLDPIYLRLQQLAARPFAERKLRFGRRV